MHFPEVRLSAVIARLNGDAETRLRLDRFLLPSTDVELAHAAEPAHIGSSVSFSAVAPAR
jgi:hypothetical protein